ncbi:MAG: MFS transporter [Paludibacter sp.]|jgi:FHS family L-fucose permease-like MFS transporter|nr:MFS transporter [Paludibacter sp.]HOS45673.1 MFS transporter [Paludibacter sp.]HPM09929.1 MFS transporter [Paludibacter sp.]
MNTQKKKNGNLVAIIMMILLFGMISFVTNLAAPMGNVLKEQFGVSNFLGMLGNAANFIAYAVMGIPGGILLQRYGYKKTALIAIALGFLGVFIQYLSGYASESAAFGVYLLGAFVAGFSMCLLNMVVNPMLNTLGGGGNRGNQLIQLGGSFNSVMATFTPTFVGILIGAVTSARITDVFPVMYIAMGVFALVFVVLLFVSIPEPHAEKHSEPMGQLISGALKFRHFVLGAIAIFVYVGVEIGTPGTLNLWLSDAADPSGALVGKTIAGFVVGTYWLLMLVGRLAGVALGAKVSSKTMMTVTSAVGIVLILLAMFVSPETKIDLPVIQRSEVGLLTFGLAEVPINAMFIVLVGLCTSIMWGGIFNLAVEGLGKYLQVASGIFMTLVVGGGIIPAVQGWLADTFGYQQSYWIILLSLAYLLYYAVIGSKNVNKDIPVD